MTEDDARFEFVVSTVRFWRHERVGQAATVVLMVGQYEHWKLEVPMDPAAARAFQPGDVVALSLRIES